MFAVLRNQLARIHGLSGTTGKPTAVGRTKNHIDTWARLVVRSIRALGGRAGNTAHIAYGYGLCTGGLDLKISMFGAEPWAKAMRCDIESRAAIDAVDIYSLSKVAGPGVASECIESKDGTVIWKGHFYPAIVNPDTGEVLPDGQKVELVFTLLTKEALSIIR